MKKKNREQIKCIYVGITLSRQLKISDATFRSIMNKKNVRKRRVSVTNAETHSATICKMNIGESNNSQRQMFTMFVTLTLITFGRNEFFDDYDSF